MLLEFEGKQGLAVICFKLTKKRLIQETNALRRF